MSEKKDPQGVLHYTFYHELHIPCVIYSSDLLRTLLKYFPFHVSHYAGYGEVAESTDFASTDSSSLSGIFSDSDHPRLRHISTSLRPFLAAKSTLPDTDAILLCRPPMTKIDVLSAEEVEQHHALPAEIQDSTLGF
jgi:hypothetical protein